MRIGYAFCNDCQRGFEAADLGKMNGIFCQYCHKLLPIKSWRFKETEKRKCNCKMPNTIIERIWVGGVRDSYVEQIVCGNCGGVVEV